MYPKFIRIDENIYSVNLLKNVYVHEDYVTFLVDDRYFKFLNKDGASFMKCAFDCFIDKNEELAKKYNQYIPFGKCLIKL